MYPLKSAFAAQLDDDAGKAPVQDGIAGVYVSPVIAVWGHAARREKSVRVIRVAEDIQCRAVTGNKLVFPIKKVHFQLPVKSREQASYAPPLGLWSCL